MGGVAAFNQLIGLLVYFAACNVGLTVELGHHDAIQVQEPDSLTLEQLLWDGQDVAVDVAGKVPHKKKRGTFLQANRTREGKHVIVMGAMDTGTNLMDAMLHMNFPDYVKPSPIWKHTVNDDPAYIQNYLERWWYRPEDIVLVIMTRTPLAQFSSWRKAPYEMEPCFNREFGTWNTSCEPKHWMGFWTRDNLWWSTDLPYSFESSFVIYNKYVRQTVEIQKHNSFHRVLPVAYEDLVISPKKVFTNLATAAEWPMPHGGLDILEGAAKSHGAAGGRTYALEKLRERSFLSDWSSEERDVLCNHLEKAWLQDMAEGSYTDSPRPYAADCTESAPA